jgi:hypothetical protein
MTLATKFVRLADVEAIGTKLIARWIAFLGFGLARFLLFGSWLTRWGILLFPAWVLVVNLYILIDNLRRAPGEVEGNPA